MDTHRGIRIKQLKACAESIMDMAEDIIGQEGLPISWQIIIDMQCKQPPEIIVKKSVITEKVIDSLG